MPDGTVIGERIRFSLSLHHNFWLTLVAIAECSSVIYVCEYVCCYYFANPSTAYVCLFVHVHTYDCHSCMFVHDTHPTARVCADSCRACS
jgi:hypothetical protein